MECVEFDPWGYYIIRWDRATPIDLLALTAAEAVEKAKAILGEPRRDRCWTVRVNRISEESDS